MTQVRTNVSDASARMDTSALTRAWAAWSARGPRIATALLLAACSPQQLADNVTREAAETVVTPILDDYMTGPQAQGATACILDNAAPEEIRALARDVAVMAGTTTVQSVLNIATRPGTMACFASVGAPVLPRTGGF